MTESLGDAQMGPARVLLAEDDEEFRRLLSSVLRTDGHDVAEAPDGEAVVGVLMSCATDPSEPVLDVIIADVSMPVLGGFDVLRLLQRVGVFIPVILITAFGTDRVHRHAHDLGAIAILDKPFDLQRLRRVVRGAVQAA